MEQVAKPNRLYSNGYEFWIDTVSTNKLRLYIRGREPSDILFQKIEDHDRDNGKHVGDLYWGKNEIGFVQFYYKRLNDSSGFYGHTFNLTMTDGSTCNIKGPWSSGTSAMNEVFPHTIEIAFIDQKTGYQCHGYYMLVSVVEDIVNQLGYELVYPYFSQFDTYRIV